MSSHDEKAATGSTVKLHQKLQGTGSAVEGDSAQQLDGEAEHESSLLTHPSYVELQNKLDEAEAKANQYWERLLRMQAEMDNIQRRVERDVANAHKYGLEKFASELLPVVDNMERSLLAPADEASANTAVREGVELTLKMFCNALEKFGVQQINPESEMFNPELHQAVSVQTDASAKPGTVLMVLQKGYLLNNRLIRPALVIVSGT